MTRLWALLLCLVWTVGAHAAPQQLLEKPLESPEGTRAANVEWDAAGFIGRIRMMAFTNGETPSAIAEIPQIKPAPANLTWITEDWFACESFVAEDGAAFVYMHVPSERAFMVEIFAPEENGDWIISYTTNDSVSSDSIQTVSRGHSSLFPILLRDLPKSGLAYLSPDFALLLSDAVNSFVDWRKRQAFKEIKTISNMAEDTDLGRLLIASIDSRAELVYFPGGTTSTREMLALTQRKPLPDGVQDLINGIDPPTLSVNWTDKTGGFRVSANWDDRPTSETEVVVGRFEGVSDSPYTGPGVTQLLDAPARSGGGASVTDVDPKPTPASSKSASKSASAKTAAKASSSKSSTKSKSSAKSKKPSRSN